jgi:DNA methyltransferase 1-associated protein 1
MADMKDILGVPRNAAPTEDKKPEKKERVKRPEGMSREAFALLGGSNPIIPRHMLDGFKKKDKQQKPKPSAKGTVVYRRKPFKNQARTDNLELVHWVKGFKDATGRIRDAHEGDYVYAKYNKKVSRVEQQQT